MCLDDGGEQSFELKDERGPQLFILDCPQPVRQARLTVLDVYRENPAGAPVPYDVVGLRHVVWFAKDGEK